MLALVMHATGKHRGRLALVRRRLWRSRGVGSEIRSRQAGSARIVNAIAKGTASCPILRGSDIGGEILAASGKRDMGPTCSLDGDMADQHIEVGDGEPRKASVRLSDKRSCLFESRVLRVFPLSL